MPNWCQNQLTVDSPMSNELVDYLRVHGLSFAKIAPCEQTAEAQKDAWSTKWDLRDEDQREAANELIVERACGFDTAWSPPIEAIRKLSEQFPDDGFTLRYCEEGMQFCGETVFEAGDEEERVFIDGDRKAFRDFIQNQMGFEPWDDDDEDEEEE